jgi:hypothetical protein
LVNDLNLLLKSLNQLFYVEMECQTSACLFGSAVTADWVPSRSDLDVLIFIPKEKLDLVGKQVRAWSWRDGNPILDGYVVYSSGDSLEFTTNFTAVNKNKGLYISQLKEIAIQLKVG